MKLNKKFSLLLIASMIFLSLSACSKPTHEDQTNKKLTNHIALISDTNGIKDNSLNQSAWQGVKNYGTKNNLVEGNKGYNYFVPKDPKDYQATISKALDNDFQQLLALVIHLGLILLRQLRIILKRTLLLLILMLLRSKTWLVSLLKIKKELI